MNGLEEAQEYEIKRLTKENAAIRSTLNSLVSPATYHERLEKYHNATKVVGAQRMILREQSTPSYILYRDGTLETQQQPFVEDVDKMLVAQMEKAFEDIVLFDQPWIGVWWD